MVTTLWRKLFPRDASRRVRKRLPHRPRLEVLEDRTVPVAIRNLPGFLSNTLPANDDGSTGAVNVGFTMNFFGVISDQLFVNNNGNVTFNQPLATFTPTDLNSNNGGIPIIAPFFADVDTRGSGSGVVQYGTDVLCGRPVFGVNYINVGYFPSQTNLLNSFQVILVDRSETGFGNFDIEFNYDQIQWETGGASGGSGGLGGNSARVGYSNGTGNANTFFELPGSGVNGAFLDGGPQALINQMLLSSTPGRLHFLVRNGQVIQDVQPMMPGVNFDVTNRLRIFNPFRWISDDADGLMRGNITIINAIPFDLDPVGPGSVDACLDITTMPLTPTDVVTETIPGPFTVIVAPPPGVTLLNANGVTATGRPFYFVDISALPPESPALRISLEILRPARTAPNTFYLGGFATQVISGPVDLTAL